MARWLTVLVGGGVGSVLRYGVGQLLSLGFSFPLATFTVNLSGSFFMSLFMGLPALAPGRSPELRLLLTTGLLGGYTTYSAFNFELFTRVHRGAVSLALIYAGATFLGCLIAGFMGWSLARAISGEVP
jgi:CrcB protein